MKKMFFMALAAMFLSACDATEIDNSTVKSVDLNRYVGRWYEIAKFDHIFERGLDFAMANYTLREDGKIDVLNTGVKDGRAKDAKGIAKTTNISGLLKVSFFGPFYSDYRILMLDTNYQYVLVGGSNENYLWILSRTPQLDDATRSLILAEAEKRGYNTSKLVWVKQAW
jgi:lipocalin